jgi:hypothetical protein
MTRTNSGTHKGVTKPGEVLPIPYEWLLNGVRIFLYAGNVIACLLMCGLLAAGFWEIGKGVLMFFGAFPHPAESSSPDAAALHLATRGLEFLFLAPLGYFLVLGVARYIEAVSPASVQEEEDSDFLLLDEARADLLIVKAFSVALFIAVIAASVVGKLLTREGIDYKTALCGSLLIVVLGIYFVALEKLATTLRREILDQRRLPTETR